MYLTNVTIDIITENKKLQTISILPNNHKEKVIIEHIQNIEKCDSKKNYGTVHILNKDKCYIDFKELDLKTIKYNGNDLTFSTEHIGLPLGQSSNYPTGIYNLILPPNYRLQDFHIIDPYDETSNDINKRHYEYEIFWDTKQDRQVIRMYMRSEHQDNISFRVFGSASKDKLINELLQVNYSENIIANISETALSASFGDRAINIIKNIARHLELKPNIAGLGINLNEFIEKW